MGNTVNPSSGVGTSSLTVTIIPSEQQASRLTASGYGLRDTVTFDQYTIKEIDPDGSFIPICEDVTYSQNADKIEYNIYTNNSLIYSGKAYKYPDSDGELVVTVNDILSDHLSNHISFNEGLQEMDGFCKLFEIGCAGVSGYKMVEVYNA